MFIIYNNYVNEFIEPSLKPIKPKLNDLVAVYSLKHKAVLRGKVLDLSDKIKCKLVDIGLVENIRPENVFELPNEFMLHKVS